MVFRNREDAGIQLAKQLENFRGRNPLVLGLARGGVPVAAEVAKALGCQLDVLVVRKLGAPGQPEVAIGAIAEDGERVLNNRLIDYLSCDAEYLRQVEESETAVLQERSARFRHGRSSLELSGREVIIVDDGLATGMTARVACQFARNHGARKVTLAIPVASADAIDQISEAEEIIAVSTPADFQAVGLHYDDFAQVNDEEVRALLDEADRRQARVSSEVEIDVEGGVLRGTLTVPSEPLGIVVFAHGSGSSRHSPRNRFVARELNEARLGTLLIDLLTADEEFDQVNVFDIELLAQRLAAVINWLRTNPSTSTLRIGLFGASTGAAAALATAAHLGRTIAAVVSRGGRPDLAGDLLTHVVAPTLLIVGGHDEEVLELNGQAQEMLSGNSQLEIVPGATHLFEEPGALERVAALARDWFTRFLDPSHQPTETS